MAKSIINKKKALNKVIDYLADEGERLIKKAYETSTFTNRLYNLHDSYSSAVYYNRTLIDRTIRYLGEEKSIQGVEVGGGITINGRDESYSFFSSYKPQTNGFHLVIVAAMFYASDLEKGIGIRRKYKVITGATGAIETFVKDINGSYNLIDGSASQNPQMKIEF